MSKVFRPLLVSLLLLASGGCTSNHPSDASSANELPYRTRNEGYGILFKLMSDESDVGKIFWFKHADDSVTTLVKAIGERCQAARKEMDGFPSSDKHIDLNITNLPKLNRNAVNWNRKRNSMNSWVRAARISNFLFSFHRPRR